MHAEAPALDGAAVEASEAPTALSRDPQSSLFPLSARLAFPAAVLSGFLYFLAFPGMDVWPLSFVALVPLIVALRGQSPRRGLLLGWLAGLTMTMCGFYWLVSMLETFSGFPVLLCVVFMTLLCAYQGGRIALLGWLVARSEQRGWPAWLAFALAFPASELLFPLLFPWYYGATVHQVPALIQVAEIGGPLLVGLCLVAGNLALAELVVAGLTRRRPRWVLAGSLAAVPLLCALYGAIRIPMIERAVERADPVRVALVQANMSLLGKRLHPDEALERHLALTRGAMQEKPVDLVVWSETSIGGAVDERYEKAYYKSRVGRQIPVPTIFGAVLRKEVSDARKYTLSNSALVTDATGNVVGRYDKQFLLGFGEYLPFGETFPVLYEWSPNSGHFTPGKSFDPLPVGKHSVATFICYEDIIPGFVNRIMSNGTPELLVNLTNDAWFGDTTEPWIHLALSKMRAVEQRRFFVRSTNSGVSAFVDPVGRVVARTPTFSEIALAKDLRWLKLSTPYQTLGDTPWWLVTMAGIAFAFVRRPQQFGRAKSRRSRPSLRPRPSAPPSGHATSATASEGAAPRSSRPPSPAGPPAKAPEEKQSVLLESGSSGNPPDPAATDPAEGLPLPEVDPNEYGAFPRPPGKPEGEE